MTTDQKVIRYSEEVLENFTSSFGEEELCTVEYAKLLKAYKRLSKRYTKTIQMSDREQRESLDKKESLENDKKSIQKVVRTKILDNVKTQRETQEQFTQELEQAKTRITELNTQVNELKVNYSMAIKKIQKLKTIKSTSSQHDEKIKKDFHKNINLEKFRKTTYKEILNKVIDHANQTNEDFVIIKFTVDNLTTMYKNNERVSANILSAILKSINGSLPSKDIIYYVYPDIFYVLLINRDIEHAQSMFDLITKPRMINKTSIHFSLGITQFRHNEDTFDTIEARVSEGNEEAKQMIGHNSLTIK